MKDLSCLHHGRQDYGKTGWDWIGTEQGLTWALFYQMLLVHAEKSMGQRLWLPSLKQLLWNIHIQERGKYSLVSIQAHRLHSDRLLSRWIILISVPYIFLENVILPQQGSTSCTSAKFCGNINTVLWQSVLQSENQLPAGRDSNKRTSSLLTYTKKFYF